MSKNLLTKRILCSVLAIGAYSYVSNIGYLEAAEKVDSGSIYKSTTITDSIDINGDYKGSVGFAVYSGKDVDIKLIGDKINIASKTDKSNENTETRTIYAAANGSITLGNSNSTINVDSSGADAMGITAIGEGSNITINADTLNVKVDDKGEDNIYGIYGIHVQNNTQSEKAPDNAAKIDINANNIILNSTELGLSAFSNGQMNINGNLLVNANNAIDVRGNSTVNINTDGKHSTVLNGDIVFETPATPENAHGSGNIINAYVNANFNGENSSLTGRAYQVYADSTDPSKPMESVELNTPPYYGNVTGLNLEFNNGAAWNMTGDSFVNDIAISNNSAINIQDKVNKFNADNMIINNSIINMEGINNEVNINNLTGNNGIVNVVAAITDEGVNSGILNIGIDLHNNDADTLSFADNKNLMNGLTVNYKGITADDFTNREEAAKALDKLAGNIKVNEDVQKVNNTTANIKEGIINGAVTGTISFKELDGEQNGLTHEGTVKIDSVQQKKSTTTMDNMKDIASVALAAWRQEDSTLSQRLGELRSSEGDQGFWTRMSRGEFEYKDGFKNQYNYYQLGYDKAFDDWHYGIAISHNDGQTSYKNGYGENDSTSLSLYGTWLGKKGNYADIVLKQGKLNNEFTNYANAGIVTGDYDMWGTSISTEYGQKINFANDWYITPQMQLTYMRIGGEDYTANVLVNGQNNKMQVNQDSMNSFVGRVGFEAGKQIGDKGSIYAKASILHEFEGQADTYLSMNGISNSYSQDIGDTWYECGLGLNYKMADNSYLYADVVKTFGGDLRTPWQWNAGVKWNF